MAGERQTGPDAEMPDGLYYSERGLWDAQAPTQAEVRVVLARLARVRAQPDVADIVAMLRQHYIENTVCSDFKIAIDLIEREFGCDAENGETA